MTDRKLPKDSKKSFVVNGIRYKNRKDYDERLKHDTEEFAKFLYDVYQDKKNKDKTSYNDD